MRITDLPYPIYGGAVNYNDSNSKIPRKGDRVEETFKNWVDKGSFPFLRKGDDVNGPFEKLKSPLKKMGKLQNK